ncbi:MAG: hypothetical protein ACTS6J_20760 [Burkholderiales bacterium]
MSLNYMKFGGGLGDVINQCYNDGNYKSLEGITQKIAILIFCHNKFSTEIFTQHPKHELLEIRYEGYPSIPDASRIRQNLAKAGYRPIASSPAPQFRDVIFYPAQSDRSFLETLPPKFISIQPFSGSSDRDVPPSIVKAIDDHAAQIGVPLIVIGRNYEKKGKITKEEFTSPNSALNLIDKLSVPGTIELVKRSALFIGGHSSMNLAAWHNRVPNYILFPEHVRQRHFKPGQADEWSFGRHYPETRIDLFSAFSTEKIKQLLKSWDTR